MNVTAWFILSVFVLVVAFDVAIIVSLGPDQTISRVIGRWGKAWPLLPPLVAFAMGALYGHLFL